MPDRSTPFRKHPLRLVYFAPSDIQVARVDRQCIVNFCDALSGIGVDVELVAIGIRLLEGETTAANPLDRYRIREPFPVRIVPAPVSQASPDWWIGLNRLIVHSWRGFQETLVARRDRPTVFYTKNYGPAIVLLALRALRRDAVRIAFEPHLPPPSRLHAAVLRACDHLFANTYQLAADLIADHGVDRANVVGTHQGVDLELYDRERVDAATARRMLGIEGEGTLVVYTGKVAWEYREVEYILEAARRLRSRADLRFLVVGGRHDHVARYRELIEKEGLTSVTFTGFVAPNEVQMYQFAADLLVLYYPSGIAINRYRSPGKLFEYMAAGRAIVSVDLPVLREVLGDEDPVAAMVAQDAPDDLAREISALLDDTPLRERLAQRALAVVARFSWRSRARQVVEAVGAGLPDRERRRTMS
jgi:glycosyltransferase involved in cell wall biosynthesis